MAPFDHGREQAALDFRGLRFATCGMVGNIEPHLQDVRYGEPVSPDYCAKHGLRSHGNLDDYVWCGPRLDGRQPELLQHRRVEAVDVHVRSDAVDESEPKLFGSGKVAQTHSGPAMALPLVLHHSPRRRAIAVPVGRGPLSPRRGRTSWANRWSSRSTTSETRGAAMTARGFTAGPSWRAPDWACRSACARRGDQTIFPTFWGALELDGVGERPQADEQVHPMGFGPARGVSRGAPRKSYRNETGPPSRVALRRDSLRSASCASLVYPAEARRSRAKAGGGGGIRTPGTVPRTAVFKTAALNRSATPPLLNGGDPCTPPGSSLAGTPSPRAASSRF